MEKGREKMRTVSKVFKNFKGLCTNMGFDVDRVFHNTKLLLK